MNKTEQLIIQITLVITGMLNLHCMNAQPMEKHQWKNRIIIIQASDERSPLYKDQLSVFSDSESAFIERKLVLYEIVGDKYRIRDFQKTDHSGDWQNLKDQPGFLTGNKKPFSVFLIGLDGGVKLKKTDILTQKELFGLIDSMPMRRQELRKQNKTKG